MGSDIVHWGDEIMLNGEWEAAIEGFLAHERAGGKRTDTNTARRQHLQHLARSPPRARPRDLLLVQEMLGHASPTTTRRYVEYDRNKMRTAVETLAG